MPGRKISKKSSSKRLQRRERNQTGYSAMLIIFQQRGCSHTAPSSCRELMKGRRCRFFVTAKMQPLLAEFPFLDPIPVFHFSKTQPSFFQFIYAINSLISVFFSIQSCRLGGQNPSCSRKCLRQNFFFLAEFSLPH
jgi:hypothetical protein